MQEDEALLIWISKLTNVSTIKLKKLLEKYQALKAIFNLKERELKENSFTEFEIKEILNEQYRKYLYEYIKYIEKNEIKILYLLDNNYPIKLKNIYDPPIVLYAKGNIDILNDVSIGIVGSRDCSDYGRNIASKISYELSKSSINIISGLAKGIDSASHIGAIQAKGKTIAVMGTGIESVYPSENKKLAESIIDSGGTLITEFPINAPIRRLNFPKRNRIISGLSNGILVVEAKEKSGALITADFALEQGKNVYAIPGNITSMNSIGTNDLIKLGAKAVTNVVDIIEDL